MSQIMSQLRVAEHISQTSQTALDAPNPDLPCGDGANAEYRIRELGTSADSLHRKLDALTRYFGTLCVVFSKAPASRTSSLHPVVSIARARMPSIEGWW